MSGKGGRTSTSWDAGSSWHTGKTKVIRVPEAIAAYARDVDRNIAVLHGNAANEQEIILSAIAAYIELRRGNVHANQYSQNKKLNT